MLSGWSRLAGGVGIAMLIALGPVGSAGADGGGADGGKTEVTSPKSGTYTGRWTGERFKGRSKPSKEPSRQNRQLVQKELPQHKLTKTQKIAIIVMCREAPGGVCTDPPKAAAKDQISTAKLVGSLSEIARTLIVRLQLPDPTPRFGPDPSVNEWKMAAVGYPLWLWTDGPTTVSNRVQAYGVTFSLSAMWQSTTFDMGDGHEVTCTSTRKYVAGTTPGRKSPECGYTYLTSSLPKGDYRVTATTNWRINWSALGQSGSLPGSHSATLSLPVGELNALVVR